MGALTLAEVVWELFYKELKYDRVSIICSEHSSSSVLALVKKMFALLMKNTRAAKKNRKQNLYLTE